MAQKVAQDAITEETGNVMKDSKQGEDNIATSVNHSEAVVNSGSSEWEQDFDRLRVKISTRLKAWEDSRKSSITKQLESSKAQQELQILKSIRSEALEAQTRIDSQAAELRNALDICRREWDELFRECQTLRARERQLADDLSEARLALTHQKLDHQADKVKLLEELNTAKSAPQLHQIKLLEEMNAAKSAQVEPLEEPSTTGLAGMTAGVNIAKMKKSENEEFDGSEIASDEEAHSEETAFPEELKAHELGRIGPIGEGPPDVIIPHHPQAGANDPLQERQRRWLTLTWTDQETYNIEGPCNAYQLAGGTFIKTYKDGNMLILQLPTSRAPVYRAITHGNLNTKSFGFASDASQNLLVLFGCDIESVWIAMYSSTGSKHAPHPEATRQILQATNGYSSDFDYRRLEGASDNPKDYALKIAGDFVGMLIYIPEKRISRLLVWNWKIGMLIGDTLGAQCYLFGTAYEFSFVSPTLFHVMTPANGAGSIDLYSIDPSSITPTGFMHLASLLLPPVTQGVKIVPARCTTESSQPNGSPNHFCTSQLSVLQIEYATQFGFFDSEQFQLVVATSVFTEYWNNSQVHQDPSLQQDICIGPTVIPAGNVFSDDVVFSLPYMKTIRREALEEDFAGFAIDEERIIAISV
ncbi:hypothetical protein EST38_g13195 [Candolleomyces aberdarensis]|uniref:Uncharacterized protein n=1 Tax=Candolleomyces aberdarensis TaxID=2316362 RepID=A0A4Q2D0I8_9AGAR|nr:hypothetical protein EST38_g13195 [Candolleomyces aberdarensis]